jgi:hypothetical protein
MHCKKRLVVFSLPQPGCHLPNLPLIHQMIKFFPARESLVSDILAGDGKTANLFYSVVYWVSGRLNSWRGLIDIPYSTIYIYPNLCRDYV